MSDYKCIFAPEVSEKIVSMIKWHGRIFVACTDGVYELFEDSQSPDWMRSKLLTPEEKQDIPKSQGDV